MLDDIFDEPMVVDESPIMPSIQRAAQHYERLA
jgi:hypothetical protein